MGQFYKTGSPAHLAAQAAAARAPRRRRAGSWKRYSGWRIEKPGWRFTVNVFDIIGAGDAVTHACVWQNASGKWAAYYESHEPGQVNDIELPELDSERDAKRAAEAALRKHVEERRGA